MKRSLFFAALLLLSVFTGVLSSCEDDEKTAAVAKPIATLAEVGEENNKVAIAGKDLHLEGELQAEGLIARIDLRIENKADKSELLTRSWTEGTYIGVRNTTFHEHVDIPADTKAGDYQLTFTVTDKVGQSSAFQSDLKIEVPVEGAPEINITEVGANNSKTAKAGGEMHLEAEITAPQKIAHIEVELHNSAAKYEKVFTFTGEYLGETTAHFHEHIAVPADAPAGEYHLHFTVTDSEGNATTEEVEGVQITRK